jgi:hypothetical protein
MLSIKSIGYCHSETYIVLQSYDMQLTTDVQYHHAMLNILLQGMYRLQGLITIQFISR